MANEWQSMLPGAWKPQEPNAQVQAAKYGAETALTGAQTAVQAIDAVARNQDRIRKQALQDVMAKSVRTSMGPDGKLIKVIDQDRFLDALSKSPAAADAYDKYVSTVYPQLGKEEVQRGLSSAITPEGGMDATKLAAAAQRSRFGADIVNAAAEQQKTRLAGAEAQAASLTGINALTTSPAGAAAPGTIVGNTQMQVRPLDASTASGIEPAVTADAIDKLSPATRSAAVLNLRAAGSPLSANPSNAEIAKAASDYAASQVQAGLAVKSLGDLPSSVFNLRQKAPATTREALGKIFGGELDVQSKKTANARSTIDLESAKGAVQTATGIADELRIPEAMRSGLADPATQQRLSNAKNAVTQLGEYDKQMKELLKKIDSKEIDMDTPEGNNEVNTELAGMITKMQAIYGSTGTEGGVGRAFKDMGAPPDVVDAISKGGVNEAARAWFAGRFAGSRNLLAKAAERAANSVISSLGSVRSSDPVGVLRDAGLGHLLPKDRLKPSVFGKGKAAGEAPNTQRSNKRGML